MIRLKQDRHMSRFMAIMAWTERELGRNNEKRVVAAFTHDYPYTSRIPWIHQVRHGTRTEDLYGCIDVVFETDVGPIYFQIKSSENARAEFVESQAAGLTKQDIIAVFINPSFDSKKICGIITPLLTVERRRKTEANIG